MTLRTFQTFRVQPPGLPRYYAAMVHEDKGELFTISTRATGIYWEPDETIHHADLMMPEFDLNEWDIEVL